MGLNISPRIQAILEGLIVTFLWSSSYILTKFGLLDIAPLTLVGLRYLTASLILLSIAIKKGEHLKITVESWRNIAVLGFLGYTVAQGFQCIGLSYLPAVTVTMILNLTPLTVLILNFSFTGEYPNKSQIMGMMIVLLGVILFFFDRPSDFTPLGVFITFVSGLGWAGYMVISKIYFSERKISHLGNTAFTMGFGTAFLSLSAFFLEGFSPIPITGWGIIIWLGLINTATAFLIWNHALETLNAFELSILQNTMLIQITILSIIFLDEKLPPVKYVYLALVFIGVYIVQIKGVDRS